MKKLRLDPEALSVQAFPTEPARTSQRGTVHGHETEMCGDTPNGVCQYYSAECAATDGKNTHCGYCMSEYNCTWAD